MLELIYTNIHGEKLHIKTVDKEIFFNHSDIHQEDEYENISQVNDYVFNPDEREVIKTFVDLVKIIG